MPLATKVQRTVRSLVIGTSIALTVATLLLWQRSEMLLDQLTVARQHKYFLASHNGWLSIGSSSCDRGVIVPLGPFAVSLRPVGPQPYANVVTWAWENRSTDDEPDFAEQGDEFHRV